MYKNHMSVKQYAPDGERNDLPSQTIKGESYTIKELLRKHVRGMMPAGQDRSPQYSEDPNDFNQPDLNQITKMDITDKNIFQQQNKDSIESQQLSITEELKKQEEQKKQDLLQKAESIAKSKTEEDQKQK